VKTNLKVAVICPPDSKAATAARSAGASLVGEEAVFEVVKSGKMDFDRLIAHPESMPKLQQAGLGRILGPRGLMPSVKLGTVVERVGEALKNMMGGSMYRERAGVLHMAIGQLGFTPDEMRANLRAFIDKTRQDAAGLAEQIPKDIHEVVSIPSSPKVSSLTALGLELDKFARLHVERRVQDGSVSPFASSVKFIADFTCFYIFDCVTWVLVVSLRKGPELHIMPLIVNHAAN